MKRFKSKRGITLIELIIAISLVAMIIGTAGTIMVFSMRSQDVVSREYQVQADMRVASEVVNQQVRHATAVFMLNEDQFTDSGDLKDGWNYFALSDDQQEIVQYTWNEISGTHEVKELVKEQPNLFYGMSFHSVLSEERMVEFNLTGHLDNGGSVKVSISSILNALNSAVVDDSGTLMAPAIALAYRSEDIPDPEKIKVAVTMVLDKSGSMGYEMGDGNTDIRMTIMKEKASELIDTFADMDNVYVSLVPFSANANNPGAFLKASDHKDALKTSINGLIANGGTNAGDGLRRSYYRHVDLNSAEVDKVLNYTILLMDGNPTYWPSLNGSAHYYGTGNISNSTGDMGGNGSTSIDGSMDYIEAFSNGYIKKNDHTQTVFMKTFVIGFTAVPEQVTRAEEIATYHNHNLDDRIKGIYYAATSSEELEQVFSSIAEYILQETWHIYGPMN